MKNRRETGSNIAENNPCPTEQISNLQHREKGEIYYHLSREIEIKGFVTWPESSCQNCHR